MSRRTVVAIATPIVLILGATAALAAWIVTSSNGLGSSKAKSLLAPQAASAGNATANSLDVSVTTAPVSSSAPVSGYRVDVVSPSQAGACYINGATGACTVSGLSSSTPYQFKVFSVIGTNLANAATRAVSWTSSSSATTAATSTSSGDAQAPTVTQNCPTSGHATYAVGNNGSSSWHSICGDAVSVNASDNVGVASVAIKVTKGTACWNGIAFTSAQCSAAGPAGYPAGYLSATHGGGSVWSVSLPQSALVASSTYGVSAQAKDAAGNTSNTFTVSFNT